ncbi:hypothetical protein GOARA_043_00100 [Gordonia araii NBRC 100433]|uniref:Uncharacterized protein n=1 Tax=Gordonia araii NBRC 100433 TaxID=1073574 RepID=G7H175_9ACTN|nr:methyltransferase [Gordonia araii]NNG96777.1 methyltransferase [Gordonia araii NBRC 100433]GAB09535.1 hypothetical protein GOARA_043_00100 [Gordonia araii NBRC 100433]
MTQLPCADLDVVGRFAESLRAAVFTTAGIDDHLGADVSASLTGGVSWPAVAAVDDGRPLSTLIALFLLGLSRPAEEVAAALPGVGVDELVAQGIVGLDGGAVVPILDVRPYADDAGEYTVFADQDSGRRSGTLAVDHVLGIGGASISLARAVIRRPVGRALDLGTGCGVQALHLGAHCEEIVATDTNERALALAAATARASGQRWDLRRGGLFEPVEGERFDLIVSNPPFVIGSGSQDYIYRDSGVAADGLCARLIAELPDHLNPGGTATVLANWAVADPDDWAARPREWLARTGLDAWVVQRELADPISYVSLWLADAGESPARSAHRGREWLDYFADAGIVAVGMGVLTLRRPSGAGAGGRFQIVEEITGAGEEVTGDEARAFFDRQDFLAAHSDDELMGMRLSAMPVVLEEQSLLGESGWQTVGSALRRPGGPGAVLALDEVSRALVAGCRGQVELTDLVALLAAHQGVDADALARAALPVVREAIARGILYRAV